MVALTATCWSIELQPTLGAVVTSAGANTNVGPGANHPMRMGHRVKEARAMLLLNNQTTDDSYPTSGGIPLPSSPSDYGLVRNIDYIILTGYGYHNDPTGPVTTAPIWVLAQPPTGGRYIRGFAGAATGAGPSTAASMILGHPELPTTWTPTLSPRTHAFYVVVRGW